MKKFPSDFWPRLKLLGEPVGELRDRRVTNRTELLDVAASDLDAGRQAVRAVIVVRDDVDVWPQRRLQFIAQVRDPLEPLFGVRAKISLVDSTAGAMGDDQVQ